MNYVHFNYRKIFCLYFIVFKINTIFERKIVNIFLPISFNIYFGCSKEPSNFDGSFE